jgi:hypothetical protein
VTPNFWRRLAFTKGLAGRQACGPCIPPLPAVLPVFAYSHRPVHVDSEGATARTLATHTARFTDERRLEEGVIPQGRIDDFKRVFAGHVGDAGWSKRKKG